MKFLHKAIIFICICMLASCSQVQPLTPCEYTQLLANIKEFFCVSIALLGQDSNFAIGQAIGRLYYGHYHLSRLIYNNIKGRDGNNHTDVWKQMPSNIRTYGETLKDLRIKYDYNSVAFSRCEVLKDLAYIEKHKDSFDKIIYELDNSVVRFNTNPMFIQIFDKNVKEITTIYQELIQRITDMLNDTEQMTMK